MKNSTVAAAADLVALRRHQFSRLADSLQAALDLQEAVQGLAATHSFSTVSEFLRCAPDEPTRALWSAWLDRATAPVPTQMKDD